MIEALVGQVASGKVQDSGGKAPHVCVTAPQAKVSVHLLWSPGCTQQLCLLVVMSACKPCR